MSGLVEGSQAAHAPRWEQGTGRLVRLRPAHPWDAAGLRLVNIVAQQCGVPSLLLLHPSRCTAAVAEARQLAMYLMHVVQRRPYADVGAFFGRDRTTVSHACAHIEDRRDRPTFDSEVDRLEAVLAHGGWRADHAGH